MRISFLNDAVFIKNSIRVFFSRTPCMPDKDFFIRNYCTFKEQQIKFLIKKKVFSIPHYGHLWYKCDLSKLEIV